jgi:hypothetical protein
MHHITHNWSVSNYVRCTTSHTINLSEIMCELSHRTRLTCIGPCGKIKAHYSPSYLTLPSPCYILGPAVRPLFQPTSLASFRSATWNITWSARRKQDLLGGLRCCNADDGGSVPDGSWIFRRSNTSHPGSSSPSIVASANRMVFIEKVYIRTKLLTRMYGSDLLYVLYINAFYRMYV